LTEGITSNLRQFKTKYCLTCSEHLTVSRAGTAIFFYNQAAILPYMSKSAADDYNTEKEAEKYLGTPYVWGGSSPETGFDCSGYVCWVLNQSGWDVGRQNANGLWNMSTKLSESEAKPGDLVFFEGTYDTEGASHVGIYVGNGMMISAGNPIKYSNIHSSYWDGHLLGFGRIPE